MTGSGNPSENKGEIATHGRERRARDDGLEGLTGEGQGEGVPQEN